MNNKNPIFFKEQIIKLLSSKGDDFNGLLNAGFNAKLLSIGNTVHFRGLIEFSNICSKNCFYCGIRSGNKKLTRYELNEQEIIDAAIFAYNNRFGSIAFQGGERTGKEYAKKIEKIIKRIKQLSNNNLGITLSLGEQSSETYKRWYESGAHRYLLRIETSNKELFSKIHPNDKNHIFEKRLECLYKIKELGYQTGTGVMIGLPYQTLDNLADDILFMTNFKVDMVGMGPFIEHADTPFYQPETDILPLKERFDLTLKMTAIMRILMPDINLVASTAMQAIDPLGREKALLSGANIMMPNITPSKYRDNYKLYENKPGRFENPDDSLSLLSNSITKVNHKIGWEEWGDSKHYKKNICENLV